MMWIDNYSKSCSLYKTQCSYLKPRYLTFYKRIVDVGFVGCWWNLYYLMEEFDINPKEWPTENNILDKICKPVNLICKLFV